MADDDYDLPRWSSTSHPSHFPIHPAQVSTPTNQYSLYGQSAPPSQPQQQQQLHHDPPRVSIPTSLTSSSSRPSARLPHPIDSDSQEQSSSPMLNLSRSASINTGARSRRQPDDLERAYPSDTPTSATAATSLQRRQIPNPFYPSSVAAFQSTAPPNASSTPTDAYMYYPSSGNSGNPNSSNTAVPAQSRRATNASPAAVHHHSSQVNQLDSYQSGIPSTPSSSLYSNTNYSDYSSQQTPLTSYSSHVKQESPDADMRSSPYIPQQPQSSQSTSYNANHSYPSMDTHQLTVTAPSRPSSHSNPSSPFSHSHGQIPHSQYYTSPHAEQMTVEPPPRRRPVGFKRVRDSRELNPHVTTAPQGRRMDHAGNYVGPLRAVTTEITATFHLCNKQFRYETSHNPRRVLTKPSRPVHNDGFDNEDYDYILYVNDYLGSDDGQKYLILDVLGQGTFGQVVKCQNVKTNEIVAVKVIKNKPAYFNQSMMEVTILQMLNNDYDPHDEHHILRLRDSFIHKNHLCLVFEQLSSNLYELIKQNQFQGLSTQLVKVFTAQLLDALIILKEARLIHCDLKPENILLKSLQSPQIKVIDFGSACHERQTVYTYIQSRFYRSPEVLLGLPYNAAIDMWSLGCIAVELFLGLPLFPGTSEYNQITRIVDLLGLPPQHMLDHGKQVNQFFDRHMDAYGQVKYRLKSIEQYSRERNVQEQPGKQYFSHKTLPDIVRNAPMAPSRHASSAQRQAQEIERENNNRAAFIDFCQGLLSLNPLERWTPQQAKMHPFITGEKFTRPFNPNAVPPPMPTPSTTPTVDPKRPYGGLLPSQPKGIRAFPDAASYNQQLVQHQVYTAQAQAASQAQAALRNPYVAQQVQQAYNESANNANTNSGPDYSNAGTNHQSHGPNTAQMSASAVRQVSQLQTSTGMQFNNMPGSNPVTTTNPNPPPSSYFPSSRTRANTVNQMDIVPPAIARLQHMSNPDVTGIGRNALTPVMQRDDAIREWERRQSGKAHLPAQPYPQLELLQQQAELAAAGNMNWSNTSTSTRYVPSNLSYQSQPGTLVDTERSNPSVRDAIMSSVRNAARPEASNNLSQAGIISAPPQAYATATTATTGTATRYGNAYSQAPSAYENPTFENNRNDGNALYMHQQYQAYNTNNNPASTAQQATSVRLQPSSNLAFYNSGITPSGQPFASQTSPSLPPQGITKDTRRMSGMDIWQR